jgi:hypothetical protein
VRQAESSRDPPLHQHAAQRFGGIAPSELLQTFGPCDVGKASISSSSGRFGFVSVSVSFAMAPNRGSDARRLSFISLARQRGFLFLFLIGLHRRAPRRFPRVPINDAPTQKRPSIH